MARKELSASAEAAAIEWRSRPWRGSEAAVALVVLLFVALGTYAAVVAKDAVWTGLTLLAAVYVLSPLTVPVSYRLDDTGLTRSSWLTKRTLAWTRFGAWRVTPNRRIAVLRFAGKGWSRLAGGMSIFLPEEPLTSRVLERLARALGPEEGRR